MRLGMMIERSRFSATCGVAVLVLVLGGCNGGAAHEARQLGNLSILETVRPLVQHRVSHAEIESSSDAAGVKTLLQFWSTLQSGDYESAARYFAPTHLPTVGTGDLAVTLRELTPLWDSTKPTISLARVASRTAYVYFDVRDLRGNVGAVEVIFERLGVSWKISFLSLLPAARA